MRALGGVLTFALLAGAALGGCLGGSDSKTGASPTVTGGGPGHNATLTADFSFDPVSPAVGQLVRFVDDSNDSAFDIVSRAWDFGDGHGSTQAGPVHAFAEPGSYLVVLRVKNDAGLEAMARHFVSVHAAGDDEGDDVGLDSYLEFGKPTTVQAGSGGEPTVAIDSEGRIYVAPIRTLYRSDDEGQTWNRLNYVALSSGDSHVVTDEDDRVWMSDLGGVTPPLFGSVTVWTSENQGAQWLKGNPAASDTVLNDRQWLAASEGGKGYLLYRSCTVFDPTTFSCLTIGSLMTRTIDGGLAWSPLGRTFQWTSFPFVSRVDGTVYVVQATNNAIDVAVSTTEGASWTQKRVSQRSSAPSNIFVVGATDDAGNPYVVWVDKDTSQYDVWVSSSTDKGSSWSKPVLVSSGLGTNVFPWVTAGADGRVVVVWYGTDEVASPDTVSDAAEWYVYAAHSQDATGPQASFVQSRATGVVHVGPICTSGAGCAEGEDRDLLDFITVALMPDGRAGIAYGEDGSGGGTKAQFVLQTGGPFAR